MTPTRAARRFRPATHLLAALATTSAHAVPLPAYPTTAPGPSSADWYPDRYAPSGFANVGSLAGRSNVLAIGISSADALASRLPPYDSGFYNTQGRKIDLGNGAPVSWIGSVYIPAAWASPPTTDATGSRRTDLWATLDDAGSAPALYPIIGFSNAVLTAGADTAGGLGSTGRFRVYDGGWIDVPTPVAYDAWNDLCVTFTGTTVEYRIGTTLVHTIANVNGAATLSDVMLQAYNFNFDYSANWSHVGAGNATCAELRAEFAPPPPATPPKPVPAGPFAPLAAALAVALAALSRFARRR